MKVFLSSTALDLVAYRKVADDTILRMSQEAVVMERFGSLPGEPAAECERKARECDVTVCVVAHRYGFVPDKGRGSITRREVEAAKAAGREVLVWIVADDYAWAEKKEQDLLTDPTVLGDSVRVVEVAASVQALLDFKAWLRELRLRSVHHSGRPWTKNRHRAGRICATSERWSANGGSHSRTEPRRDLTRWLLRSPRSRSAWPAARQSSDATD
jgi:hypothetical protein